MDNMKERIC